jgi:hypothetical protein
MPGGGVPGPRAYINICILINIKLNISYTGPQAFMDYADKEYMR